MSKYNKYKKLYEKDQQTIKSFDNIYRKSLQDNVIDKKEFENLCNISHKNLDEKSGSFYEYQYKSSLNFF